MLERDPFGREGKSKIFDAPEQDRFSVEGVREGGNGSVFGNTADLTEILEKDALAKKKRSRVWVIGGLVVSGIIVCIAGAFGWAWYRSNVFHSDRVVLSLSGADTVSGNNTEHFVLSYENQNGVDLENAVILFRFPDNFIPEERNGLIRDGATSARFEMGAIKAKQKGTYDFYGYFSGTTQSMVYIRTSLQYSPKSISGSFQQEAQKGVQMETSAIGVDIAVPIEAAAGDTADISVQYQNRDKEALFSVRLKMQYPEGFEFVGSDVPPAEGNTIWYLDPIAPGETRTIKLHGKVSGDRGSFQEFSAVFGTIRGDNSFFVLGKDNEKVKIVGSPFSVKAVLNSGNARTVFPGSELKCSVQYSNDGDVGLNNVVVQAVLNGKIFDDSSIQTGGGSYDAATKTITWRASDVPELAFIGPKKSGALVFSVSVKSSISMETGNDTRFVGSVTALIDSADVPDRIGTRRIVAQNVSEEVHLGTAVSIATDLRENGTNTNFPDVIFQVGKETELVVYMRLRNTFNDVSEGKITMGIPSNVSFAGMIPLEKEENVTYDDRAHQLVWNVGMLRAGTGSVLPDRVIAFRIKVTPQEQNLSGSFVLLDNESFQGKDVFTGDAVTASRSRIEIMHVVKKD